MQVYQAHELICRSRLLPWLSRGVSCSRESTSPTMPPGRLTWEVQNQQCCRWSICQSPAPRVASFHHANNQFVSHLSQFHYHTERQWGMSVDKSASSMQTTGKCGYQIATKTISRRFLLTSCSIYIFFTVISVCHWQILACDWAELKHLTSSNL